ncbi:MAG: hypothetical protein H7336_10565 [Bacteriovorax sp.]|nr:hypothetical protein [Bacteriovorax sp.]
MKLISIKKGLLSLSLCLLIALSVTSCASSQGSSRGIAQEQKNDVAKITDGEQAPNKFHSKRFEPYNSLY